jgi:predicted permease
MRWIRSLLFRLQPLFRRNKIEAGLADELRSHLEFATEAHLAAGLTPAEARRAAERELGGIEQIKESWRDHRSLPWLDHIQQDVRTAFRSLRKTPGFTAVAVLSLGVAIGVNTTSFSLVNGLLLRPLAPLRPDELVTLFVTEENVRFRPSSHDEYVALRAQRETFADVAATLRVFTSVADPNGLQRGVGYFTSENFLSMLGITPHLGRFFTAEECRPNAGINVVIASHAFWQRLGGRDDFVGSTVRLNGKPFTVIGIAARGFDGVNTIIATDCWLPLGVAGTVGGSEPGQPAANLADSNSQTLLLTARLASPLTIKTARARLPAVAQQLPTAARPRTLKITELSRINGGSRPSTDTAPSFFIAGAFLAVAAGVFLIAGFNLGNMLLARGADRAKEIALRTALGATRGRIVRQLLTEGLLLALAGGVLGFLLTLYANRVLYDAAAQINASYYTLALNLSPDFRVFAAVAFFCLFSTLVFSFLPALNASRVDLVQDLKRQGGETTSTHRLGRFFAWRHVVLMLQIALSFTVIFCSSLFIRGALSAGKAPFGYDPSSGLVAEVDFSLQDTPFADSQRAIAAAIETARAQPGVIAAAATTLLPYGNMGAGINLEQAEAAARATASADKFRSHFAGVTSGYFDALGVRLLRGRDFTAAETSDPSSAYVAIIDEGLARRMFPNGDALGQRLREPGRPRYSSIPTAGASPEFEIVGICSPHRLELHGEAQTCLYVPLAANLEHRGGVHIQIRTSSHDPALVGASVASVRSALFASNRELPLVQVAPFTALIDKHGTLWLARFGAVLLGTFGAIALLIAVTGIYGVKAYAVARRTREIGIRMALGAPPRAAFTLIFRQALLQTALALAIGVLLALGAGRVLNSFVYKISGTDPVAIIAAGLILGLAALAACWMPARRASKVDPMIALRCE